MRRYAYAAVVEPPGHRAEFPVLDAAGTYTQIYSGGAAGRDDRNSGSWRLSVDDYGQNVILEGARTWGFERWGQSGDPDRPAGAALRVEKSDDWIHLYWNYDTSERFERASSSAKK